MKLYLTIIAVAICLCAALNIAAAIFSILKGTCLPSRFFIIVIIAIYPLTLLGFHFSAAPRCVYFLHNREKNTADRVKKPLCGAI